MQKAFRYAMGKHNEITTNPFALVSYIDEIDVSDSYTLATHSKYKKSWLRNVVAYSGAIRRNLVFFYYVCTYFVCAF